MRVAAGSLHPHSGGGTDGAERDGPATLLEEGGLGLVDGGLRAGAAGGGGGKSISVNRCFQKDTMTYCQDTYPYRRRPVEGVVLLP